MSSRAPTSGPALSRWRGAVCGRSLRNQSASCVHLAARLEMPFAASREPADSTRLPIKTVSEQILGRPQISSWAGWSLAPDYRRSIRRWPRRRRFV